MINGDSYCAFDAFIFWEMSRLKFRLIFLRVSDSRVGFV